MMLGKAIATLLLLVVISSPVCALTISFVDNSILGPQNVIVRYNNGSYVGKYNTTSTVLTLDANESYIFQLEPTTKDYISNPVSLVDDLATYAQTNMVALVVLAFLFAIVFLALRRR